MRQSQPVGKVIKHFIYFFKSRNKKKLSMGFHKNLLTEKLSHSSNLSIQESLQNAVFMPSANLRVGDI